MTEQQEKKKRAPRVRRGDVYAGKTPVNVVIEFPDIQRAMNWAEESGLDLYEAQEQDTRTVVSFVALERGTPSGRKGPVVVETKQVIGIEG